LRPLRRAPGPRIFRRPPAHRLALLHQFGESEVCEEVSLRGPGGVSFPTPTFLQLPTPSSVIPSGAKRSRGTSATHPQPSSVIKSGAQRSRGTSAHSSRFQFETLRINCPLPKLRAESPSSSTRSPICFSKWSPARSAATLPIPFGRSAAVTTGMCMRRKNTGAASNTST
jgi:hypothetical protein